MERKRRQINGTEQKIGEKKETIVAKVSDGQQYPMPLSKCWLNFDGERGSGPEGVVDVTIL